MEDVAVVTTASLPPSIVVVNVSSFENSESKSVFSAAVSVKNFVTGLFEGSAVDAANASTDDVRPPSFRSRLEKLSAEAENGMESSEEDPSREEPPLLAAVVEACWRPNSLEEELPFLGEVAPSPVPPVQLP